MTPELLTIMTITLPDELREAIAASGDEPVRLTDPVTDAEYLLLPADRSDDSQPFVDYDDSPWTKEEKRALLIHAGERAGWNDPEMDI